jgi:DNA-binding CsgD family transcriptional regulator
MFARRQLIERLRKDGQTNLQIAEELGWGNRDTRVGSEVHRMRELGWDVDNRAHTGPDEMARRKEEAAMLWESGMSASEISYVLEISESACDAMLFRMRAADEIEPHQETPPRDGPVQAAIASMAARGDTYQEIADRMHMTPGSVSGTIYRVRRRVAPYLQPTAEVPPPCRRRPACRARTRQREGTVPRRRSPRCARPRSVSQAELLPVGLGNQRLELPMMFDECFDERTERQHCKTS